jgi:ribonuclease HI
MDNLKEVIIYTDGGCDPNPGSGGYGVVMLYGRHRKELSGGFRLTTNNRMELMAVIEALKALKEPCRVKLYSDSEYVVNAMTLGWIENWLKKDWKKVKNPDLWQQLAGLTRKHQVEFNWVKGHAGIKENERCDELALMALKSAGLPADEAYETSLITNEKNDQNPVNEQVTSKITDEGQPCRKCSEPVIRKERNKNKSIKPKASFYYEYFFICPGCGTIYFTDKAKVMVKNK